MRQRMELGDARFLLTTSLDKRYVSGMSEWTLHLTRIYWWDKWLGLVLWMLLRVWR